VPPGKELPVEWWATHHEELVASLEGDAGRLGEMGGLVMEVHPHEPAHWYLVAIGTRPEAQGGGRGGALLTHTLALADAHGEPAYLEASSRRSRSLYERHGFEVMAELQVADSPPLWPMWRDPR
jgi:ribosomal protein S18 acetylase RimI-like enzyme